MGISLLLQLWEQLTRSMWDYCFYVQCRSWKSPNQIFRKRRWTWTGSRVDWNLRWSLTTSKLVTSKIGVSIFDEDGGVYGMKHSCGSHFEQAVSQLHADPLRQKISDSICVCKLRYCLKLYSDLARVSSKMVAALLPPSKSWAKCLLWTRKGILGHVVQFSYIDAIQITLTHIYLYACGYTHTNVHVLPCIYMCMWFRMCQYD